jgi:PhnB protein
MTKINPYLNFNGDCLEAFGFYKDIFGGEFSYVGRYSDMPADEGNPVPDEAKDLIMPISLPISKEITLMGSDVHEAFSQSVQPGSMVELLISVDSKAEADRIWTKLSEGATIQMPLEAAFWGDYYGNLIDKFGIRWSVNCPIEE